MGGLVELQSVRIYGREVELSQVRQLKSQVGGSRIRAVTDLRLGRIIGQSSGCTASGSFGDWNSGSSSLSVAPIEVTARWGVADTWPADVWAEMLDEANSKSLTRIENLQSTGSLQQAGFGKSLDVVGIITQKDLFTSAKTFDKYSALYRRTTL